MIFLGYIMYCDSLFKIARNVVSVNIIYISYIYFQNVLRRITIFFLIVWKCAIITKDAMKSPRSNPTKRRYFLLCREAKLLNNRRKLEEHLYTIWEPKYRTIVEFVRVDVGCRLYIFSLWVQEDLQNAILTCLPRS